MSERDSFIFYRSFYDAINSLDSPEDRELCYRAIFEYGLNKNEIELSGVAKAVFVLVKPQLEANARRYENGKKGGRKKASENQTETKMEPKVNQTKTEKEPNVNVNVNVNDKKNTKKKADFFLDVPEVIKPAFMEWVAMRKQIKKPVTTKTTVTRALNELKRLSNDPAVQVKIINQSIDHCWQSFFALKEPEVVKPRPMPKAYSEAEPEPEIDAVPCDPEAMAEMRRKLGGAFG